MKQDIDDITTLGRQGKRGESSSAKFGRTLGLFPLPVLVIALAAFVVLVPMLFRGEASGHDFEFHLNSWMEVVRQWHSGILYPRWAELAHYGYGEARFIFYPPISWLLGAALGSMLPWAVVPGVFIWLALTLSGVTMFCLARRWFGQQEAVLAAVLYLTNPYYMLVVYWRSSFAELLCGALLPLLLICVLRLAEKEHASIPMLALVIAAAWLTDVPAAIMVNYSVALLIVVLAILRRSPRMLWFGAAAVAIGMALAGFYTVPAAYEQKWVNIDQVLSPGLRPQDNFLFTFTNDADHNRFNLLISITAVTEIVAIGAAIALSGVPKALAKRAGRLTSWKEFWWPVAAWGAVASALMIGATFPAWEYLPKLRFAQLPWRWLLCLNVALVLLVLAAWKRWFVRVVVFTAMGAALVVAGGRVLPPYWDRASDVAELHQAIVEGQGYEGTDEYVPAGADPYEIQENAERVKYEGEGEAQITQVEWRPEWKSFVATTTRPGRLVLRLFNYPAWKVDLNGRPVTTATAQVTGQMVIAIESGENHVRVAFTPTWDRRLGFLISLLSALGVVGCLMRRKKTADPSLGSG